MCKELYCVPSAKELFLEQNVCEGSPSVSLDGYTEESITWE